MVRPCLADFEAYTGEVFVLRMPEGDASVESLILEQVVEHPPLAFGPYKGEDCFSLILGAKGKHAQRHYRLVRSDQKEFALFCTPVLAKDMKPGLQVVVN